LVWWWFVGLGAIPFLGAACFFGGDDSKAEPTASATEATTPLPSTATATPSPVPTVVLPADVLRSAQELYREGRFGEARDAFQALAERLVEPAERADALIGAGNAALQLDDVEAALGSFREAAALAPSGSPANVRASYILLKQLNDLDREVPAELVTNTSVGSAGSRLGPYLAHERARALARSGRMDDANAVWGQVLANPGASRALRESIWRERAELAREADDGLALASALESVIGLSGDPAARFERAMIAKAAGEFGTYSTQLGLIIAQSPSSRFATQAIDELRSEGYVINPGEEGLVYYRRGSYGLAIGVLGPGVDEEGLSAEAETFRAFYLGASYEDSGQAAAAIAAYDRAATTGAGSAFVHRAKYWAARVTEGAGGAYDASERYVALVGAGPSGEFTQEAAFRAGYVLYLVGDTAGALAAWDITGVSNSARLEFWRGRAFEDAGQSAAAMEAYRRAVAIGPVDLHGLEAAKRLGEGVTLDVSYRERDLGAAMDWAGIASWLVDEIGGSVREDREPTAACELQAMGLRSAAEDEIWAAADGAPVWDLFALMREAKECGLSNVAAQLAVNLRVEAGVASHEAPKELLRVSYPIDYAATLANEARKAGLDPLWMASVVRQESFWDPDAGSVAGALGLTQVIPPTGAAIAAELGIEEWEPSDLFRPATSLEFGAYYMGNQVRAYGDPLLALAAYNAGPAAAARWSAGRTDTAADLVETIDFLETKAYVTYIVEAYAHYLLAWGD